MSDLEKKLAALSPEKRKLLEQKLKQKGSKFNSFPLSFAQQRLWFLDQLEPGNPAYNIPAAFRLIGTLNHEALEKSLNEIVNRHEILRTTFTAVSGKAVQIIDKKSKILLEKITLKDSDASAREAQIKQIISKKIKHRFNLTKGPLGFISLITIKENEHILLMVMHHIISDGWSMGIIIAEFGALYQAYVNNQQPNLPKLKIQYADFAQWQHKWLSGERLNKQLSFWKKQLGTNPPILKLPTDYLRPAILSNKGKSANILLPEALLKKIQDFSRTESVTTFMTFLAVFQALLYRYSGQTDIYVGTPIANRNRAEIEPIIGFFVNTLVMRGDLSGEPAFREYLQQVKETALNAYGHQDLPFEMLVEAIQTERNLNFSPLFQVMFVHTTKGTSETQLPGLTIRPVEFENTSTKFDLTLRVNETINGLQLHFDYNAELFTDSTINGMLQHYQRLLEGIIENSSQKISSLQLLKEDEYEQLTKEWNKTKTDVPLDRCIHQLFEQQAAKNPSLPAVFYEGTRLTFGELNKRANQVAAYLIRHGVGADTLVGLYLERSTEMIVALLGILKAGGAYVPLDVAQPIDRLLFMIEDAGINLLISQTELKQSLADFKGTVLSLDETIFNGKNSENPNIRAFPGQLAYVIYTSGTTGKPKGIAIKHESVINLHTALNKAIYTHHQNGPFNVSVNGPLAFDTSVKQLIQLLNGHALYVVPADTRLDGKELLRYIRFHKIGVFDCTPSQLRLMIDAGLLNENEFMPELMLIGGEAIDQALWKQLSQSKKITFYNVYGPTECTVDATQFPIGKRNANPPLKPVIGKAVANTKIYILDSRQNPVPVGIPGELCIGGLGLARGYLNRPDLTAEKFIPNPFANTPGSRMYRSGDRARFLPDGNVESLGRIDHQVKVRGYRIELAEIENTLTRFDNIKEAVVKALEQRLVAFIVFSDNQKKDISLLRKALQNSLPDYMVPALFVPLDALPLTPNGKLDRHALTIPGDLDISTQGEFVAPRSNEEEIIAGIFAEILNIKNISATDNFFEIGGHSLLATQVISRITDSFKIELPLRDIFQAPTVEQLALRVRAAQLETEQIQTVPLKPVQRNQKLPLSFAQQRLWFLDQLEPGSPFYNIPSAYSISGELNIRVLTESMQKMVERHEILRTLFTSEDGKAYQHILDRLPVKIPQTDLSALPEKEKHNAVQERILKEAQKPFDLSRGPLFRTGILVLGNKEYVLLLTMHHIISDAWSMRIFIKGMAELYKSIKNNVPSRLPQTELQYADFTHWQRNWLQGDVLDKQLDFWKKQLGSSNSTLDLPIAKTRPAVQTYRGAHLAFELEPELTTQLKEFTRQQSATLFMTTLAAFNVLLFRYSGQDDINIGSPIANRNRSAIENIIGFFVNTLVLRTDLSGDPSFTELIRRVKETALGAFSHQDVPFEKLLDVIHTERNLSHSPLFQVMFVLQNTPMHVEPSTDFNLEFMGVENNVSQFDLTLTLNDNPQKISGGFEYNTDIFDGQAIEQMVEHFKTILSQMVRHPQQSVSAVTLLKPKDLNMVTKEWNQSGTSYEQNLCVHHLFERQAQKSPRARAVIVSDKSYTYEQLNSAANQVARFLRKRGIATGSRVGLCVERSFEMLVGLFGILKSGAAYVPLDPNYPDERIAFMIKDARLNTILTQANLKNNLQKQEAELIFLDSDWEQIAKEPATTPEEKPYYPENIAYIIYTSGSTGTPKGVLIPHRSVVNHNQAVAEVFGLFPEDIVLQFATINFDTAVEEIFPALNSGAALVLRGPEVLISGGQLVEMIRKQNISVIDLPTAYWHQIVTELRDSKMSVPESLRLVVLGGDKINAERFMDWNKIARKGIRLINTYGPTETTVISALYEATLQDKERQTAEELPIGRPLANTSAYILDKKMNPVPVGIPGELFTGGVGLAHGYLDRPDLTADKFVPDPFSEIPGSRLYKTGDRVCFRKDGNIDFLGRVDQQVKIRGFRVEIGEIENLLNRYPQIKSSVVVPRQDKNGLKRLVAYFTVKETAGSADIPLPALREFLSTKLPEYMVPSAFMALDKIPYMPNGKIDVRNLPLPDDLRNSLKTEYAPPQTENEKIIAEIMQEVLGQKKIGINDNFFELGGDSILSIQVVARASQKGLQITPVQMFKYQTIAQLAAVASTAKIIEAEQGIVEGTLPLTPIQQWFFAQPLNNPGHWNQSLLFQVNQSLEPELLKKVVRALLSHHDALRLQYEMKAAIPLQINAGLPESLPFIYVDGTELKDTHIQSFIEEKAQELQTSIKLKEGTLLRIAYFNFGTRPGRLLLIVHHLAMDGISWRILLEDFQTAYQQTVSGQEIILPRKTASYKEWAEKLERYAASEKADNESSYWLNLSQQAKPPFAPDFPNGMNTEASTIQTGVSLTEEETQALLQEVPKVYNTEINDILLTALVSAFAKWNGKRSVLIHMEGHGRENIMGDTDISRTLGWFTSLYPVFLELGSAVSPGDAIKTIKEQLRQIPNKGIGFGILRYLSPQSSIKQQLTSLDKTYITFNYLGQFDQALPSESILAPASEKKGTEHDPGEQRSSLIDISGATGGGKLSLSFAFSKNLFRTERIQQLSETYIEQLRTLIAHCQAPEAGGRTASDFKLAGLDNKKLDKVMTQLQKGKKRRKK